MLTGCSSAPKRPVEVFTLRNMAETQLEMANKQADQGNYAQALSLLDEARRFAVSTDDPRLLIREGLSRGNILYNLGQSAEAVEAWNRALAEAELAGEIELAALVRIYIARSRLLTHNATADEVKTHINRELSLLKSDQLSIALAWTVIGLAEKENRRWTDAEAAVKKALDIHEKNNYLELAAYNWFVIASIRSSAEHYDTAEAALWNAIGFDRRAENTYNLGMDWRALGDVYKKAGKQTQSLAAYRRAADIFRSISLEDAAQSIEERMGTAHEP
jgi:tetratricopeptide (TPR) repeat protein